MIIACGQDQVLPGTCVECGDGLDTVLPGGYPATAGRTCSEDCAAAMSARVEANRRVHHLHVRDLLCECVACTESGHPTEAERREAAGGEPA